MSMDKVPAKKKTMEAVAATAGPARGADGMSVLTLKEYMAEDRAATQQRAKLTQANAAANATATATAAATATVTTETPAKAPPKRRKIPSYQRDAAYLTMFSYGAFPDRLNNVYDFKRKPTTANTHSQHQEHKFPSLLRTNIRRRNDPPQMQLPNIVEVTEPRKAAQSDNATAGDVASNKPTQNAVTRPIIPNNELIHNIESTIVRPIIASKQSSLAKLTSIGKPTTAPRATAAKNQTATPKPATLVKPSVDTASATTVEKEKVDVDLQTPSEGPIGTMMQRVQAQNRPPTA